MIAKDSRELVKPVERPAHALHERVFRVSQQMKTAAEKSLLVQERFGKCKPRI